MANDKKKSNVKDPLKSKSTPELQELLETLLTYTDHEQDVNVNMILLELLNRGIDKSEIIDDSEDEAVKQKIKKAFDVLNLGLIENK